MNGEEKDTWTPDEGNSTASPGWRRTYKRWRMLTWVIATAFLILPIMFLLYLGLHQVRR